MALPIAPAPSRDEVIRRFAGSLFYDIRTADILADYFVRKHADFRCKGSELMDDLARAILTAPFDMTLVMFYALATPTAKGFTHVPVLSLFAGHALAFPIEFLVDAGLYDMHEALRHMTAPNSGYYSQVRAGYTRSELVLEAFTAKRELAQHAWPPLLLALCYRHYVRMLDMCVKGGTMDESYARTLVVSGTATLRNIVEQYDGKHIDASLLGRLELLSCVSRDTLMQQLTRLHVTLSSTIDLETLVKQLEKLAVYFTGYCRIV